MWPDMVSNPGPLTYESGALPTALRGPASADCSIVVVLLFYVHGKHLRSCRDGELT